MQHLIWCHFHMSNILSVKPPPVDMTIAFPVSSTCVNVSWNYNVESHCQHTHFLKAVRILVREVGSSDWLDNKVIVNIDTSNNCKENAQRHPKQLLDNVIVCNTLIRPLFVSWRVILGCVIAPYMCSFRSNDSSYSQFPYRDNTVVS